MTIVTPFSDQELEEFRVLILSNREAAVEDVDRMRNNLADSRDQVENDTAYSHHMADAGTDAMEQAHLYQMIARQQKYIGYLDRAMNRINAKTYGICKVTGKPIDKGRLLAVPHTETSLEAKNNEKK